MSGIAGIVHRDGAPVDRALVCRMLAAMAFRGPDRQDLWTGDGAALAHSLLAINDKADDECQPRSLDGAAWITADARLDDRDTLLAELVGAGRRVKADVPDTDLILHAYHAWGDACVEHLTGDFAFGIWDAPKMRLTIAVDHLGTMPLYYMEKSGAVAFSNTLAALRDHPLVSDRVADQSIADYLLFGGCPTSDTTLWADIQRVPPAHVIVFAGRARGKARRYWSIPDEVEPIHYAHAGDYVEQFRTIFRQAVADRVRGTEVAVTLSGGLDSSSVAAMAMQLHKDGVTPVAPHAYSCGFDWLILDNERHYASLAAAMIGLPVTYLCGERFLFADPVEGPWRSTPEPRILSQRRLPLWGIFEQAAASGRRVLLTGLGGDPLLEPSVMPWPSSRTPHQIGMAISGMAAYRREFGRLPKQAIRRGLLPHRPRSGLPTKLDWLAPELVTRLDLRDHVADIGAHRHWPTGRHRMARDPFWASIMSQSDPEFTGVPIRARHPFMDRRLIEFVMRIPTLPWFADKLLLRSAMRNMIPDEVRLLPKTSPLGNLSTVLLERGLDPAADRLAAAPILADYVDPVRLWTAVGAPSSVPGSERYARIEFPLELSYWLSKQQRITTTTRTT